MTEDDIPWHIEFQLRQLGVMPCERKRQPNLDEQEEHIPYSSSDMKQGKEIPF